MDNAFIATMFEEWDHRTPTDWQRFLNKVFRKLRVKAMITPPQPHMANVEVRMNLFHLLEQTVVHKVLGHVVELGCNSGDSTIVMERILSELDPSKELHAFDSFRGLPELSPEDAADGIYAKGSMATDVERFKDRFRKLGMRQPVTHVGYFEETVPKGLPDRISFALIDGDLYTSTKHVLPHVYERLSPGAICMLAVYYDEQLLHRKGIPGVYTSPGVKRATDEFFKDKPEKVSLLYSNENSNGYFRKL